MTVLSFFKRDYFIIRENYEKLQNKVYVGRDFEHFVPSKVLFYRLDLMLDVMRNYVIHGT